MTTLRERLRVAPGTKVKLRDIDPDDHGPLADKDAAAEQVERDIERMAELQYLLYAENRRSVLICLQGLDASGKDGAISHVFRGMDPQGIEVSAFKAPSHAELARDFLWRIHARVPARGRVGVFNRSHYEDVLVVRVHELVPKDVWSGRYERINEFEKNLVDAGTTVLKFYLHISEDEQLRRFERRLDEPVRRWKISESDYEERKLWPAYVDALEDMFRKTSTPYAPWYIVPANRKWFRNLAIASIVVETMESLGLKTPKPSVDIDDIRKKYHAAAKAARAPSKRNGSK